MRNLYVYLQDIAIKPFIYYYKYEKIQVFNSRIEKKEKTLLLCEALQNALETQSMGATSACST